MLKQRIITAVLMLLVLLPALFAQAPWPFALLTLVICAVVQILVHVVYFLHINTSAEQRSNLGALLFTAIVVAIVVAGSVWIMINLNSNMVM